MKMYQLVSSAWFLLDIILASFQRTALQAGSSSQEAPQRELGPSLSWRAALRAAASAQSPLLWCRLEGLTVLLGPLSAVTNRLAFTFCAALLRCFYNIIISLGSSPWDAFTFHFTYK